MTRFPRPNPAGRGTGGLPLAWALLAAAALGIAACGQPLDPAKWEEPPGEIPKGSGLLTGEKGAWELYRGE